MGVKKKEQHEGLNARDMSFHATICWKLTHINFLHLFLQVFALQQEKRALHDDNASLQSKVQALLEETDLVKEQLEAFR